MQSFPLPLEELVGEEGIVFRQQLSDACGSQERKPYIVSRSCLYAVRELVACMYLYLRRVLAI